MQSATQAVSLQGAMRAKECASFLGIAESTFWKWVGLGRIPKGRRLSARATVWLRSDLEKFLEQAAVDAA